MKLELDTPCLILDLDMLEKNLFSMQAAAVRAGKQLRPHAKTHKCTDLARMQMKAGAVGICAAKLSEAEKLVKAGLEGILLTGPVVTAQKIERLAALRAASPSLIAAVDNPESVAELNAASKARGLVMDVLLDVDAGLHRTGVPPAGAADLAEYIAGSRNLRLRGIQAYAGHVQHIRSYGERKSASLSCMREAVNIFRRLKDSVPGCDIFSASGTGTFDIDASIPEITEMQVGSYVCMDAEYRGIGSAGDATQFTAFDPALRLLTTVVSSSHRGFVTVDAGLKTLYRDGGLPQVFKPAGAGLTYDWFGDEYGRITSSDPSVKLSPGTVLELIPAHCDPTINLFDRFVLLRNETVAGELAIDMRGCSQ